MAPFFGLTCRLSRDGAAAFHSLLASNVNGGSLERAELLIPPKFEKIAMLRDISFDSVIKDRHDLVIHCINVIASVTV